MITDIEADPEERDNLYGSLDPQHQEVIKELTARIAELTKQMVPAQNRDEDPAGTAAAKACGTWVPWKNPSFSGACPGVWCADLLQGCSAAASCATHEGASQCAKTCRLCK